MYTIGWQVEFRLSSDMTAGQWDFDPRDSGNIRTLMQENIDEQSVFRALD